MQTKLPFRRRQFQIKCISSKEDFWIWDMTEICSLGCNWQYVSIGSDNGLVPNRRQAIIWTNDRLPTYICVTRPQCPTGFILGNISVTGGVPSQRADNAGFGIFFSVSLNKRLNQPSSCRWFKSPWHSLWRHCNTSRPMSYPYAPWKIWMKEPICLYFATWCDCCCKWAERSLATGCRSHVLLDSRYFPFDLKSLPCANAQSKSNNIFFILNNE